MAASEASSSSSPEVFPWLKTLPLAPEYHPTPAEFRDPISYIFKIEKEASRFGICKIVPPAAAPAKKAVLANLNASLEARGNGGSGGTFTTRQQQIGFCPRRSRPVQRPVWQSGERYTLSEFEAKAKAFERGFLRKCSRKASASSALSPLEIETMYWKATLDKPFSVEYANDMPGSAFAPIDRNGAAGGNADNLAETAWNMRAVSRAKGSLLRFMKEEIPGVTSPMVYAAMLFSWFAWHVEDHDLHSLNYLHFGAGKTWYGVPRDAAVAFEEVVRVHGYNGEINPLVIFSILGEKTTVMSPEVFVRAGVPCCRLVQNAGEFVVTFPRAYHTGFSHGFNFAEAANIATPEWLSLAKDAAIRRASINYPPMVSHLQLLYDLALELCSRIPVSISSEPRSSRLKDKRKGEGETIVKELFVRSVLENNDRLHSLGKGSPIVLLPKSSSDSSVCSRFRIGSQSRFNYSASLAPCNSRGEVSSSRSLISDDLMIDRKQEDNKVKGFYSMKGKLASLCEGSWVPSLRGNKTACSLNCKAPETNGEGEDTKDDDRLSDHRLFSCVTCGILSFDCVAIIKPNEPAARYLMSADCSFFNDWVVNSGVTSKVFSVSNGDPTTSQPNEGRAENGTPRDIPVRSICHRIQMDDQTNELVTNGETNTPSTALGLLALNYGNSSDSDEDPVQEDHTVYNRETNGTNCSTERNGQCESSSPSFHNSQGHHTLPELDSGHEPVCSNDLGTYHSSTTKSNGLAGKHGDSMKVSRTCSPDTYDAEATKFCKAVTPMKNENIPLVSICDEDSSRMHVFCLEHAVEVEELLREIGGVNIQLLCHPDYPRIEAEAKALAEELGINHLWNNITFRDTNKEDEEMIQAALDSEEAMHKNGDWAVKLGINLFYSANLSRSPLYSKQMPYNSVIYNAFGRSSPASSSARSDGGNRRSSRQRKFVAGNWCGKVWMSNQVHPLLVQRDPDEEEDDEDERGLDSWEVDVRPPRLSNVSRGIRSAVITRKNSRKRKMGVGNGSRKSKCVVKREDEALENSMDEGSHEHHMRSRRGKNAVRSDARLSRKVKHVETEDLGSDDSVDDGGTQKRSQSLVRGKKATCTKIDDVVSDDSLVGFSRLHKQILRSKRAKHTRREDMVSDDSLDCDSHRVSVIVPRSNKTKLSEPEAAVSDDLVDSNSHQPVRKILKSNLTKFMAREDSAVDDILGNNNLRKSLDRKTYNRSKRLKSVEMEEESLDEPVVNMRTRRSKPTKSIMQSETILASRRVKQGSQQRVKRETPKLKHQNDSDLSGEEDDLDSGPSTRLRKKALKPQKSIRAKQKPQQQTAKKKAKTEGGGNNSDMKLNFEEGEHACDMEGCIMSFGTRQELALHKRNICPVKGCGKKFFSHKYLVQHRRVHIDDRPLRCPWKGCKMTFKWAWAKTEHIRVHTGARPYICAEPGCGQTFRFVSDFSRHKRKTGHSVKKGR